MSNFLLKARALGQPNLIVADSQDAVTAVCLLQELHLKDSLCCLPMETKVEAGSKSTQKHSFCPFCQYSRSNDPSYMNHIICRNYNANYGCGKCLDEVHTSGQLLQIHEDLQGPPQGGHGQGHCRRHRQHHIWEKEEEQVKGSTT